MGVALVGGGARSGKSSHGQRLCEQRAASGVFIATGEARDEEMRVRIRRHQADRGPFWRTVEAPVDLAGALERLHEGEAAVLVDCLTLWLSNVLLAPDLDAGAELGRLIAVVAAWRGPELVLVTNEVGCGIVPENALAREFRDLAGRLNQRIAEQADEVCWMVFGVPLMVKGVAR